MITCPVKFTKRTCCTFSHGLAHLQIHLSYVFSIMYTGTCDCFGAQWTGSFCDICSETFYGPDCLPLLTVLNIIPNQGLDRGGNDVHVWGHNFPQSDTYQCKFDTDVVNGVWVASMHVVCSAPKHAEGIVSLEISPDGIEFSNNKVSLRRL